MSAVGAYLAKKNWNPGNKKNVEDVWKKEQAKKNEEKKLEELRREYEEERNREQLEELQVKAGVKKSSTRLEWMYDGAPQDTNKEQESEAFLLGEKSIDKLVQAPKLDLSRKAAVPIGSSTTPSTAMSNNQLFLKRHEDPMAHMQEYAEQRRHKEEMKEKHRKRSKRDEDDGEKSRKKSKKSSRRDTSSSSSDDDDDKKRKKKKKHHKKKKEE